MNIRDAIEALVEERADLLDTSLRDLRDSDSLSDAIERLDEIDSIEEDLGVDFDDVDPNEFIHDDDFADYARDLARETAASHIDWDSWPFANIDWDDAARDLQSDYTSVDFDGETYWRRSY